MLLPLQRGFSKISNKISISATVENASQNFPHRQTNKERTYVGRHIFSDPNSNYKPFEKLSQLMEKSGLQKLLRSRKRYTKPTQAKRDKIAENRIREFNSSVGREIGRRISIMECIKE